MLYDVRFLPLIIFLAVFPALAQNPFANDPKAAEIGNGVFHLYCAPCHGMRAQGGRSGPDLTRGTYRSGNADEDLYHVIAGGIPGTEMQSYSASLTPDLMWRLVAFIRSSVHQSNETAKGNTAAGEALFRGKGGCGSCHSVGTQGGWIGPELTRIGRQRSLAHLKQSIIAPDEDPTPGYAAVTVITRGGQKITGIEKGLDNFTVQLLDLSQKFHSFEKSEVTSVTREPHSLMPATYGKQFGASEIDDLVAYLAGLQGSENK